MHTKFLLRIKYFFVVVVVFFFRFIFSDVDLNPIMHSSVWCVVLTFLILLLKTQDGNGKLSIFCSQNLNSFSSLASPYKFSGRTCSYSQTRTLERRSFFPPGSSVPDVERTTGQERTPGSQACSLSNLNCSNQTVLKVKSNIKKLHFWISSEKKASLNSPHQSHFILVWQQHETLTAVSRYDISIPFVFPQTYPSRCLLWDETQSRACVIYCVRE